MLRRESGYWSESGDFEYGILFFDDLNDYTINPSWKYRKWSIGDCTNCHENVIENDFVFSNGS